MSAARALRLGLLAVVTALPSAAWSQAAAPAVTEAQAEQRIAVGLRVAVAVAPQERGELLTSAPQLEARWQIRERVSLELHWGVAAQIDGGFASPVFRPGNPWLVGTYRRALASGAFAIGLGFTAPVARVDLGPDGRAQRSVFGHTLGAWGLWNAWLWSADRAAITLPARASRELAWGELRAAGAIAALPPVRETGGGIAWVGQAAGELCHGVEGPRFCGRASAVVLPTSSLDKLQLAVGARVEPVRDRQYFALLLVNVDAPFGFGRGLRLWGLHVGRELPL